jgi:hypothetical protein
MKPCLRPFKTDTNELRAADVEPRIQPIIDWLQQEGFAPHTFEGMPSLTVDLPKEVILRLETLDAVSMIYLIEQEAVPEMDTAAATDRVPPLWTQGIDGSGEVVAILETNKIDTATGCLNITDTRNATSNTNDHKTRAASIVACDDDPYRGWLMGLI